MPKKIIGMRQSKLYVFSVNEWKMIRSFFSEKVDNKSHRNKTKTMGKMDVSYREKICVYI